MIPYSPAVAAFEHAQVRTRKVIACNFLSLEARDKHSRITSCQWSFLTKKSGSSKSKLTENWHHVFTWILQILLYVLFPKNNTFPQKELK